MTTGIYISPFWAGVAMTILAEVLLVILLAGIAAYKKQRT